MADGKDLAEDEYIVARIAGTKIESGRRYYLIEWEGYDLKDNTWEDESNVFSTEAIKEYKTASKRQNKSSRNPLASKKALLHNTFDPDTGTYTKKMSRPTIIKKAETVVVQTQKRQRDLIETETESVTVSKPVKEARIGMENLSLESKSIFDQKMDLVRQSVPVKYPIVRMANHQLINKRPVYYVKNLKSKVTLINEVDDEIPTNFIYIDQLVYTDPVQPPDPDFLPGCDCSLSSDCSLACHDVNAYDSNGRLIIHQGTAIYECNQACGCSTKCKNRVVQMGRKIPLQVFKTPAKGWGVRSTQFIPKGTFIEEYIGEVIKVEEGDARGAIYDKLGCSYLFDMDFAQSELATKYVIDSYILGNVSRFFNHSCSPNLEVYAVFYDSADNQMHRLAFFAKRDIYKDEELCFDYNGRIDVSVEEKSEDSARYSCHCQAKDCRKWIYH
ncbi:hypothetical protein INT47_006430 [Mucor saturninus]|uniref:Histone-lysine N-methyltransferase n=1 Tax=Mucor saturninus TaxID=64648 RepID=A0A8H7URR4_9FUNG|nr:hypothetical protein INT47_006430 [Mucor saturninus]